MPFRDAWYWTKVVLLNSLLNGSPELPYYEPRAASKWFLALVVASATLVVAAGTTVVHGSRPEMVLGPVGTLALAVTGLVLGMAAAVFAIVSGMRLGAERSSKPACHRLFAAAVVTTDPARRRTLAREAAALDANHVASRLLLADAHEHELGELEPARVRLAEVIDAIGRARAIKRAKRLPDHHEMRLRAVLVDRLDRLRRS